MKTYSSASIISSWIVIIIAFCTIFVMQHRETRASNHTLLTSYTGVDQSAIPQQPSSQISSGITASPHSPCIRNPRIDFFMYHYIRAHDSHDAQSTVDLSVDPQDFRKHMSYIHDQAQKGTITLMKGGDFLRSIDSGCFPAEHIWIFTSDDGWSDTYSDLFPIANEYHIPFFLGIIVGRINTHGFVTDTQIREIAKNPLFTISSHSMTHQEQDIMNQKQETKEMCTSKMILENIIQAPVLSYIYPVGHMSKNSSIIAQKCGYTIAWSTGFGEKWDPQKPQKYRLNRIRIHRTTSISLFEGYLR